MTFIASSRLSERLRSTSQTVLNLMIEILASDAPSEKLMTTDAANRFTSAAIDPYAELMEPLSSRMRTRSTAALQDGEYGGGGEAGGGMVREPQSSQSVPNAQTL